jgi:hypothetical protein
VPKDRSGNHTAWIELVSLLSPFLFLFLFLTSPLLSLVNDCNKSCYLFDFDFDVDLALMQSQNDKDQEVTSVTDNSERHLKTKSQIHVSRDWHVRVSRDLGV